MQKNERPIYMRLVAALLIIFLAEFVSEFIASGIMHIQTGFRDASLDATVLVVLSLPFLKIFVADKARQDVKLRVREEQFYLLLKDILEISFSTFSKDELFHKVLERIVMNRYVTLRPAGALFLMDKGELSLAANVGFTTAQLQACGRVPLGRCLCGRAARAGKVIHTEKVGPEHEIRAGTMGEHGHYCLPIRSGETVIGVLALYLPEGHEYNTTEVRFLESVCAILAQIVAFKQLEEKTVQLQKLESIGRFAGSIAHDFNNILTPLKGFNSLALETVAPGETKHFLEEIKKGLDRSVELVGRMMTFSRKPDTRMTELDVNEVLAALNNLLVMVLEKKRFVKLELGAGKLLMTGNRNQLEQVFMNLAVNARDAMPENGTFLVKTELVDRSSARSCLTDISGSPRLLKIQISDTGSGMSKETLGRIFEPFYTTKDEGKGTGLGLSTAYSIVKQHNGCVEVESEPGKGTVFTLWFAATDKF